MHISFECDETESAKEREREEEVENTATLEIIIDGSTLRTNQRSSIDRQRIDFLLSFLR